MAPGKSSNSMSCEKENKTVKDMEEVAFCHEFVQDGMKHCSSYILLLLLLPYISN